MIQSGKYKMICCNDTCDCPDFEERKQKVLQAFDYLLPERSSYELRRAANEIKCDCYGI